MIEMIKSNKLSGRTRLKTIPIKSYDHWKISTRMCTMFYVPILITRFRIQKFFFKIFFLLKHVLHDPIHRFSPLSRAVL